TYSQERPTLGSRNHGIERGIGRSGKLTDFVEKNGIHTFKIGAVDLDGLWRGKRVSAEHFLNSVHSDGTFFCNILFGWDMQDEPIPDLAYTGWHTGFRISTCVRTCPRSRRCRGNWAPLRSSVTSSSLMAARSIFPHARCLSRRSRAPSRWDSVRYSPTSSSSISSAARPVSWRAETGATSSRSPKGITPAACIGTRAVS